MAGVISSARSYFVLVSLCLVFAGCGSDDPAPTPVAPTPTTSSVQVRATGDASGTLEAGQTRQLLATATQSTGSTSDVTQQATWLSATPAVATVSAAGLVTAVGEGQAEISATFQNLRGTIGVGVRAVPCALSISPGTATFGPFGGTGSVQVLVSAASCRWSARSDTLWLPFVFEPATPGSGNFSYTAPANSTTDPRTANIVITTSTGESTVHAVTVNRTTGCSYVTDPEEAIFSASGGTGQFRVVTTPNTCQWNLVNGMAALGVQITSGFSGTGGGQVRYSVQAHTRDVDADGYLEIAGLSGDNPNGRHHIVIKKR
ncbi:MAG: Ig-like domain-containing protein [Vicinamibacteraceae bacterium]